MQLAAEQPGEGLAKVLALRPEVKVIDYTGSTGFGTWLEQNARQAPVFTEKAGVNTVVIDSTDDYRGMLANLAFSLSLYSGQMCTTPQNLLVPRDGITADGAHKTVDELAADLAAAVDGLLGDDARATALLGAVVNPGVLERLEKAPSYGDVVLASRTVTHPDFPDAVVRTPAVVKVDVADRDTYLQECFGPVSFLVTTGSTAESIDLLRESVRDHGAITAAVYSTDDKVLDATEEAALDAGVALSENLTETVYVNQSAAFSDFHATGANPAANSALTDAAYVASRFRIVQSRRHLPADPERLTAPAEAAHPVAEMSRRLRGPTRRRGRGFGRPCGQPGAHEHSRRVDRGGRPGHHRLQPVDPVRVLPAVHGGSRADRADERHDDPLGHQGRRRRARVRRR